MTCDQSIGFNEGESPDEQRYSQKARVGSARNTRWCHLKRVSYLYDSVYKCRLVYGSSSKIFVNSRCSEKNFLHEIKQISCVNMYLL